MQEESKSCKLSTISRFDWVTYLSVMRLPSTMSDQMVQQKRLHNNPAGIRTITPSLSWTQQTTGQPKKQKAANPKKAMRAHPTTAVWLMDYKFGSFLKTRLNLCTANDLDVL